MNIDTVLTDFDIVRSHYLQVNRRGVELPLHMDAVNFNKAHKYALELYKLGILSEISERIQKGVI